MWYDRREKKKLMKEVVSIIFTEASARGDNLMKFVNAAGYTTSGTTQI